MTDKPGQKQRIKEALKKLLDSDRMRIEVSIDNSKFNIKPFPRIWYNKLILTAQQKIVPCHFKNWLMRTTGMTVGHDACIPHDIEFDPYFTELIEIGAGALPGGGSKILTHNIIEAKKGKKLVLGKAIIEERTLMGGLATMMPGSKISKHSMLNLCSTLENEIPEGELWGGNPAKLMVKFTEEDIHKYFKHPTKDKKEQEEYYKSFSKQVTEFMNNKDPKNNYLKIYYNGNRAGPGNDWWKARNIVRIFYNGIIVEICKRLPHCFVKTLLLKMAGVKIGKNVKIRYGCIFDHLFCDTITLEDNVKLDKRVYIDGHEYTMTQTVFGKVRIKKNAHLKHDVFVRTGTTVGENCIIEPNSMLQKEIPDNEVWEGVPAKFVKKIE